MSPLPLTFVVGTGRSGSTALSRIINLHPGLLSLNEFFSVLDNDCLPEEDLDGEDFWQLLNEPHRYFDRLVRDGLPLPEFRYAPDSASTSGGDPESGGDCGTSGGVRRHTPQHGIPPLCHMTLPHLSDSPDELLDALEPDVREQPPAPVAQHYERLFQLLAAHTGDQRRMAVERSGYSLPMVSRLRRHFPYARFIHLFRDGPDCAVSMSRHMGFRAAAVLQRARVDSFEKLDPEFLRRHYPELAGIQDDAFDLTALRDCPMPVRDFGTTWSELTTLGVAALAKVPAPLRTSLDYADLIREPYGELTRIAGFLGIDPDPEWLRAGAALLDGGREGAARRLPRRELAALRRNCRPGTRALRAAGLLPHTRSADPAAALRRRITALLPRGG